MPTAEQTNTAVRGRYQRLAPIYDWANLEPLLCAIELLELRPRARVLDLAAGPE